MNDRERKVQRARQVLTDAKLLLFLRAVRSQPRPMAVQLINERLDKGETLDQIFYDGEGYGFTLAVKKAAGGGFRISFGCEAGPLAGDWATWDVVFGLDDRIQSATQKSYVVT